MTHPTSEPAMSQEISSPDDKISALEGAGLDIYCIAIGGTGMAPLACLLKACGHRVRGVDGPLYPPMSTLLEAAGIRPEVGWDVAHLEPSPDLVVVGNAVPRSNPEALEVERRGIERLSMPEALWRFFLAKRRPVVVAGTHGKTTTTAIAAWVWTECGGDPGYLIGGMPRNFEQSFRVGSGPRFVIEGDEYNAAYFDRGPKFLHYRPQTLILTSVEHDHVDLYPDPESFRAVYRKLIRGMAPDSLLVACGDDPDVRRLAEEAPGKVVLYGFEEHNAVRPLAGVETGPEGGTLRVERSAGGADGESGEIELRLAMPGPHNVANALAVWTAARHDGYSAEDVARALAGFRGVKRRLEELGAARGVTVVDDFAHHPTAVGKSLAGLREHYPGRRVTACFEPRSLTAGRSFLLDAYVEAFAAADRVLFAPIFHAGRLDDAERLDLDTLCRRLASRGVTAERCASVDALLARALAEVRDGEVLVTMSSGGFEGLPGRLLAGLEEI